MYKVRSSRLLTILLMLALTASLGGGALAQDATPVPTAPADVMAFEIYPKGKMLGDFFDPTIDAGDTAELTVVLANTGTVVFTGRTYAINALSGINGGFTVAEAGTPPEVPTTWLDYPEDVYTLQPKTGIERTFTVTVPKDTKPGQYITALALETAEAQAIEGSENFQQLVRFAVPVFITVPGPVEPGFEVGDIALTATETGVALDIQIVNTGNVRVRPTGTVKISDAGGTELYNAPVSMGSVYAWGSTSLLIELSQPLAPGDYTIEVVLNDPATKVKAEREVKVAATAPATPAPPPPVQFFSATGTPRPDANEVQFLDIAATIDNSGEPLTNVNVVLHVTRDGDLVEDFPLASSLALPVGQTPFQTRYIPGTGWSSGTWQFTLSIEAVDPSSGVSRVLATTPLDELVIP
ncbi:MAG: hypothetical protein QOF33_3573 [Thermomicrobiales bacterium]|nr:hypothetical protein [Thermomicrobiales bacterium]